MLKSLPTYKSNEFTFKNKMSKHFNKTDHVFIIITSCSFFIISSQSDVFFNVVSCKIVSLIEI